METLIILLCVWSVAVTAYLFMLNYNMISQNKINKNSNDIHKELLDRIKLLEQQNIDLVQLCSHMTQVSKDIATKVVEIEKRVDKQ